jgi:hypothetical protein
MRRSGLHRRERRWKASARFAVVTARHFWSCGAPHLRDRAINRCRHASICAERRATAQQPCPAPRDLRHTGAVIAQRCPARNAIAWAKRVEWTALMKIVRAYVVQLIGSRIELPATPVARASSLPSISVWRWPHERARNRLRQEAL